MGRGSPTVLLEGGYAATSMAWAKIEPRIARTTSVCAYDRAGYGFSDPGPAPRDGKAIAADLDAGLRAAGIGGPFVLVGHSAGALYVRLFAAARPNAIVGMVLAEPSVAHQDARFAALFGPGAASLDPLIRRDRACQEAVRRGALPSSDPELIACVPKRRAGETAGEYAEAVREAKRPATWATRISELANLWTTTSQEIDQGPLSLDALPLIVLTAGDSYADAPANARPLLFAAWSSMHRELANLSTRGVARIVPGASHMIIIDSPSAVAEAVSEVVAAARARPRSLKRTGATPPGR